LCDPTSVVEGSADNNDGEKLGGRSDAPWWWRAKGEGRRAVMRLEVRRKEDDSSAVYLR